MPEIKSNETLDLRGTLDLSRGTVIGGSDKIARAALIEQALQPYPITLTECRVWDAVHTVAPGTAATDDLALVGGTWGSVAPTIQTIDAKAGGTTAYTRFRFALPMEYMAAGEARLVITAATSAIADTSSSLDAVVYKDDEDGGISADLCATAAQSINSATAAGKSFTITATALAPGDVLDVRLSVIIVDAAGASPVIASISRVAFELDIKG